MQELKWVPVAPCLTNLEIRTCSGAVHVTFTRQHGTAAGASKSSYCHAELQMFNLTYCEPSFPFRENCCGCEGCLQALFLG
jgi:hypothetical protein